MHVQFGIYEFEIPR